MGWREVTGDGKKREETRKERVRVGTIYTCSQAMNTGVDPTRVF